MLKLGLRNIFRHGARTALALGSIVFGITGLILSGGFIEDLFVQLREVTIHSQLGHMQVYKAGYYAHGRRNPYAYLIDEPHGMTSAIGALPDVSDVLLRVEFSGLASTGRADRPILGEGIEPAKEARLGTAFAIETGRQLTDEDTYGILLGQGIANSLRLAPGDYVTLLTNTPEGALNSLDFEVVGQFRTFSKDYDDRAVRIPLAAAQELLATGGVHSMVVSLDRTESTERVVGVLRERLSAAEFEVHAWLELADFYRQTVAFYARQFAVLQFIIFVMVLLSVINSVNMAIFERTGEFGTLMALGTRSKGVFRLIMVENAILGLIGAALGAVVGIALAWGISQVGIPMPPPPNSNLGYTAYIRIVPSLVGTSMAIGAVATATAAFFPARRMARVPIVDALGQNV